MAMVPTSRQVTFPFIVVAGSGEGLFSYFPSEGAGNLVASTGIAMAGTDDSGNAYLAGNTTYFQTSPGHWFAIQQGSNTNGITWYTAASEAGPWSQVNKIYANGIDSGIVVDKSFTLKGGTAAGNASENWYAPSGDATGVTDSTFIAAYLSTFGGLEGILHLLPTTPANPYYIKANVVTGTTGQYIQARGAYIKGVGTGDVFRWVDTTTYSARNPQGGGGVLGFPLIDGTGMGAGSIGYHAGDILQLRSEVAAQNFTGAGSWGVLFDNQNFFTEQMYARTWTKSCTNHVGYQFGGAGTKSFARADSSHYIALGNVTFNGVVLGANANVYDTVNFGIFGNFTTGSSGSPGAALVMGAGAALQGRLDIGCEAGPAGAVNPQTISFGAGSSIQAVGYIDFLSSNWATSNLVASGAGFIFDGNITGADFTLVKTTFSGGSSQGAIGTGGTIKTNQGGTVTLNPAGAVTGIIIQPGTLDQQDLVVENVSPNTITFAVAATSNVAAGASATVPGLTIRPFKWKTSTALWYGGV